jgi:hypothetical protein
MMLCFVVVYSLLPTSELLISGGLGRLMTNIIQLLLAGSILLIWLYSWNLLVKAYFWRSLRRTEPRASKVATRKRK